MRRTRTFRGNSAEVRNTRISARIINYSSRQLAAHKSDALAHHLNLQS
jgi:hypothetical protein